MTLRQENHFLRDGQGVINTRTLQPWNDETVIYLNLLQILRHLLAFLSKKKDPHNTTTAQVLRQMSTQDGHRISPGV